MQSPGPTPADVIDIFLQPGDFYFGDERTRIRTLLGSCVAIVLWHPRLRVGGMCHYMLPRRPHGLHGLNGDAPDGRYAEDAMRMFMRELHRSGTAPTDYQAKLIGAGRMFDRGPAPRRHTDVSEHNMEAGRELLARHGFRLHRHDLGGHGHRNVIFDLWSGDVWLKQVSLRFRNAATEAVR